ncbi:MAG: choloylglycine hydrolase, partial [Firmicutes bacterium]|nr:choloylglycine hydrolase [Bacillota bacterium]
SLNFRHTAPLTSHFAMIGMAYMQGDYPLYYEATNEKGLSIAGLNFPGNADYKPFAPGFDNVAPFEFIPWVLGQCESVEQAKVLLSRVNLLAEDFSPELPCSPLHWMISDGDVSIAVESVKEGLKIHDNPAGVLTNNPPFEIQMWNLNNYMSLSPADPACTFGPDMGLNCYSRGMGALGLPGDMSSVSRFVRAAFIRANSPKFDTEESAVSQFFHMLSSVAMTKGSVLVDGNEDYTIYSCCCNTDRGIYYYTTYDNSRITAVDMHREDLDGTELAVYSLAAEPQILLQNNK